MSELDSDVTFGFMDDITLSGELGKVEKLVESICISASEMGFHLNPTKCDFIMDDYDWISSSIIFKDFIRVKKDDMILQNGCL